MAQKQYDSKTIALVAKHFEKFYASEVFSDIIDNFSTVCELLGLQPTNFINFYPELKLYVKSCQGQNLFKVLDERSKQAVFQGNIAASNMKMVVVGAGPIGLRTAVEAQLLGAKVTVIEKRTSFTRNNVLHLWPWVIEDLKSLGAKNFYPRFCTGTMNHISIRRLQCILLKTALCFGVEVYGGVEFAGTEEPDFDLDPWRLTVSPAEHPVNQREVDVLIGAEGKRVTVPGFRRKEFRGKLAIAITANFINKRTTAEAVVEEISGIAFVYKQDFFNNLYEELGIALENIVYYKDETHYFVMTTKKHSLLDRNVLKKDLKDPIALLSPKNVNKEALYEYIRDACDYCTDYQLPKMEFALNHYNLPDVALFDFTSMFASANASYVLEKKNSPLLFGLVGDGLLEPFWPTGTGIARGFLGAFDCCWMLRQWAAGEMTPSEVMAERESILKLLPQTTQENITKDFKNMTIFPKTRYPNLPNNLYSPHQVQHLYVSDTPEFKDSPRYEHPSFKQVISKVQLKKRPILPVNSSMRFEGSGDAEEIVRSGGSNTVDHNPSHFYKTMMDRRVDKLTDKSTGNDTLADKLDAKRASLEHGSLKLKGEAGSGKEEISLKTILNSPQSKAEFVKKMSKTFGYGMPSNAESKTDTLASEAEKCALLVKSSNIRQGGVNKPKRKKSGDAKKSSKTPVSRDREVKPWDFRGEENNNSLHSSVAPIVPTLDIEIDPELDFLLAELEHDDDFSKLPENEQKSWLESLFFQDTLHLAGRIKGAAPRDKLNATRTAPKNTLRVNMSAGDPVGPLCREQDPSRAAGSEQEDPASVTSVHVNDKMKSLAQDFFKPKLESRRGNDQPVRGNHPAAPEIRTSNESLGNISLPSPTDSRKSSLNSYSTPPTSRKPSDIKPKEPVSINASIDEISGVNKNLCSLAQSYFSSPNKAAAVARKSSIKSDTPKPDFNGEKRNSVSRQTSRQSVADSEDDGKASLVAAFFGGGKQPTAAAKGGKVRERAAYEPEGVEDPEQDADDEELDRIIHASQEVDPPPPPPRKLDKQALMLRMLGNATGILQGKR